MARLTLLLVLADITLIVVALVDCLSAEPRGIRAMPRTAWVFAVLLGGPIGAIAWFVAGRPAPPVRITAATAAAVAAADPAPGRSRPARTLAPIGPDDDPDFLRELAAALRTERG